MQKNIILGLDPGSIHLGFGLIDGSKKSPTLITYGVIKMEPSDPHMARMRQAYTKVVELIQMHAPTEVAIEAVFFGKNVQSMLKLGRAQGVAIAAALAHALPVTEYAPCKVKQAITGRGRGSKQQVSAMVSQLLSMPVPKTLDGSDALAIALCHSQQQRNVGSSLKGWSNFIKNNKDRVISSL